MHGCSLPGENKKFEIKKNSGRVSATRLDGLRKKSVLSWFGFLFHWSYYPCSSIYQMTDSQAKRKCAELSSETPPPEVAILNQERVNDLRSPHVSAIEEVFNFIYRQLG